ncbi:hypothetical protein PN466_18825 [Roseofilum reptotaenium CS-1145]|uniref:Uncharacterized protein n=1 Tax=Roseofilum reptotaenium AO1-A TaxID=1925591 RepID=A0A1L9QTL2_9CYAN|nr:hypothetical protein [Roseofilum reptotaenium]MDB9519003.1 hypothetical protein [Roseofilum reptotaenium CS-1145]OJJ26008.1 hypothetical protein BI308_08600 [Roseofilum reptotaenium AO1-A]
MSESQQNINKDRSSPSGNRKVLLEQLQIGVSIIVAIFGIYTSWQATIAARNSAEIQTELKERAQENQRVQKFVELIQAQLENLAGEDNTKAKIALISLYNLAEDDDEKRILFTIPISSQNQALTQTISGLILDDDSVTDEFKGYIREKLSSVQTAQNPEIEFYSTAEIANRPDKELLQKLTEEQSNVEGWIYLGKIRSGSQTLEDDNTKTIKQNTIPQAQTNMETITSINLRERGTRLANIKGIIPPNSRLKVEEVTTVMMDETHETVWAKISLVSAN